MPSPFEILGLLPSLVRELSPRQLDEVAKSAGKALQRIHHPDRGGDADKSMTINHAMEQLMGIERLKREAQPYLKNGPGQANVAKKEAELEAMTSRLATVDKQITDMENNAGKIGLAGLMEISCAESWSEALLSPSRPGSDHTSIVDAVGVDFRFHARGDTGKIARMKKELEELEEAERTRESELETIRLGREKITELDAALAIADAECKAAKDRIKGGMKAQKPTRDEFNLEMAPDMERRQKIRYRMDRLSDMVEGMERRLDNIASGLGKDAPWDPEKERMERVREYERRRNEGKGLRLRMRMTLADRLENAEKKLRMLDALGRIANAEKVLEKIRANMSDVAAELPRLTEQLEDVSTDINGRRGRKEKELHDELKPMKQALREKTDAAAKVRDELERMKSLVARCERNIASRPLKIAGLKARIEEMSLGRQGRIDDGGWLWLEGEKTRLRLAGTNCSNSFLYKNPLSRYDLRPLLREGWPVIGIGWRRAADGEEKFGMWNTGVLLKRLQEPAARQRVETAEKELLSPMPQEEVLETGLAKSDQLERQRMNPLEALGISPAIIAELGVENSRVFVRALANALKKVLHPEHLGAKDDVRKYTAVNEAASALANDEAFAKFAQEYVLYAPQGGRLAALDAAIYAAKGKITQRTPVMARLFMEKTRKKNQNESDLARARNFLGSVYEGLYVDGGELMRDGNASIFRSGGCKVVAERRGTSREFVLEERGFTVIAKSEEGEIRILGCLHSGAQSVEGGREGFKRIKPVLSEGRRLVGIEGGKNAEMGTITMLAHPAIAPASREEMEQMRRDTAEFMKREEKAGNGNGNGNLRQPAKDGPKNPKPL